MDMDPFELQTVAQRFEVFRVTSEQMARAAEMKFVGAGIEMAMWDIVGKALDCMSSAQMGQNGSSSKRHSGPLLVWLG
jgi:L-alanine-DL-glutamate epimerase-like enolase superfamily enzyme